MDNISVREILFRRHFVSGEILLVRKEESRGGQRRWTLLTESSSNPDRERNNTDKVSLEVGKSFYNYKREDF